MHRDDPSQRVSHGSRDPHAGTQPGQADRRCSASSSSSASVEPGETVAIVSDLGTRREYIQAAFAAAEELGADIYEMCVNAIPGWTNVGVPTIGQCKGTLEALHGRRHGR